MLVNTTATHTVINASNPKRSCANAPFTNVRGAALESSPNCTAASTPATPAVVAMEQMGSGGTLAGVGLALQPKGVKIGLADPEGAALHAFYTTGKLDAPGTSITEGIGQGRITANLEGFTPDYSYRISDGEALPLVEVAVLVAQASRALDLALQFRGTQHADAVAARGLEQRELGAARIPALAPLLLLTIHTRNGYQRLSLRMVEEDSVHQASSRSIYGFCR
mgnify:CR=1 FL=1